MSPREARIKKAKMPKKIEKCGRCKKANEKWLTRDGPKRQSRKQNAWKSGPFMNASIRKKK